MKRNLLLIIGLIGMIFPISLRAQEGPKISGFVQGLYQANLDKNGKFKEGDDSSTLRMRRVRVSIDGKLTQSLSYKIQGDFTGTPALVDAYVKYKPCNEFAIQVGQFKTPFSIESPINPVNLEIFDYGESISKLVGYKDVSGVGKLGRDIGVMASGDLFPVEGKDFAIVNYSIGVFNGTGANALDNNNKKDIVGRLNIHPMLKDLTLSGSYYYGQYNVNDTTLGVRNRWSAGAQYNDGDLVIRAEYLSGLTNNMNSQGYYAVAGYNFRLGKDKSQKLMPVLRYEHFAKDTNVANGATSYYTAGINYWPVKSLNFKLDYSLIQPENGSNSHRVVGIISYKF